MEGGASWSQLPSVTGKRPGRLGVYTGRPQSASGEASSALRSLFHQYDHQLNGYLSGAQLSELFNCLRCLDELTGTALSDEHAASAIAACCATDECELSELTKCIAELDRRLEIVRNVRWEFEFLDTLRRGLVSEEQAKFLFQATHNECFSLQQFNDFIGSRPRLGSAISFEELELEICKVPTADMIIAEIEEAERKGKARAEKSRLQASARQAEEEQREMSLRLAAATRAENERREREARRAARVKAVSDEEESRRQMAAEQEQMASHSRNRKHSINLLSQQRQEAARARDKQLRRLQEKKSRDLQEQEAREKARQDEEQERAKQQALREEQLRREKEEEQRQAELERAKKEEKRRRKEEERLAREQAEVEENTRREAEEDTTNAAKREAEALAEAKAAAAALASATDEDSKAAAQERQKQAKKRAKVEQEKRVRGDLKAAVKSRQIARLEPAIKEATSIKPPKAEWPELTEAETLLKQLKAAMELKGALTGRKLEMLLEARRKVNQSGCAGELAKELAEANSLISKLEKLARQKKEIMDMKASVISELRSYSNPPPAVHKVLTATFLLLGLKERDLKNWQSLQALMGKTGKESLKRRVSECEPQHLATDTIQRVKRVTHGLDVVGVGEISATAATFALWVETMVEEAESHLK